MTTAGKPRRWTMAGSGTVAEDHTIRLGIVDGPPVEVGKLIDLREDKACEEDVDAVAKMLAVEFNGILAEQWDEWPNDTLKRHRREQASKLLDAVFGGPDDNE